MRERSRWKRGRRLGLALAATAAWAPGAQALPITLPTDAGPRTFDSEQFADGVLASRLGSLSFTFQGPFPAAFDSVSVPDAVLGADLSNGAGIARNDSITLGFSRPGPAVAIWEAGALRDMGDTQLEASVDGGATFSAAVDYRPAAVASDPRPSGYQTNFALLDAASFGLPPGAAIDALRIRVTGPDVVFAHTDILAAAAVPEPSSLALLALGLVALAGARRRAHRPRRGR